MHEAQEPLSDLPYWQTLRTLVAELEPRRPLHAALKSTLHVLAENLAFERSHLILFDTESRTLRLCLADSPPKTLAAEYSPGVGVTGQVFATGKPVIVENMKEDPLFQNKLFQRTEEEMTQYTFLCVPILPSDSGSLQGEVLGTLSVDSPRRSRPDREQDCAFLEVVAALIANHAAYLQEEMVHEKYLVQRHAPQNIPESCPNRLIALSRAMRQCLARAESLAVGRSPVFLYGELSTGKEELARTIHSAGSRQSMPFICCDCEQESIERLLFGTHKGFEGERQSVKGLFEQAHGGTIFLHHVDALPPAVQEKLLSLLHEQTLCRLGDEHPVEINVRLIMSCAGRAGDDLNGWQTRCIPALCEAVRDTVYVPSLRERKDDILALSDRILCAYARKHTIESPHISRPAADMLLDYHWPGNLNELRYCLEQAAARCEGTLRSYHLPVFLPSGERSDLPFTDAVARFEKEVLHDALHQAKGNMLQAARILGTSYRIVNYKVKKYGLKDSSR